MEKNKARIQGRTRQKQKLARRTVIILVASCLSFLVIGLTVIIHLSRVDSSRADQRSRQGVAACIIDDDIPINDFAIPEPVIKVRPAIGSNTRMIRKLKTNQPVPGTHE